MNGIQFSHFDRDHWHKVKAERIRQGIADKSVNGTLLTDHPLLGAQLLNKETLETFPIEKVKMNWDHGRFVSVIVRKGDGHGEILVENISSNQPWVARQVAEFEKNYEVDWIL